ncbi:hypothetical protein IV203_009060 [Nitzschia inconspicua]|uniref:Uncharacterized protein n=1 Tax=Nitzschia inconspicua TaxID=303405 RepID=A0A9K3L026_9STRA|nr:hypothetical protein IV203_009060 [Nitzschia inconspicua]
MMAKYNRVAVATNSKDTNNHHQSHLQLELDHDVDTDLKEPVQSTKVILECSPNPQGRKNQLTRRANSQRSLGSNPSLGRSRSGEETTSSRIGSFDAEEAKRQNGTSASQATQRAVPPQSAYPNISTLYKESSFDLDDDDDDDHKYNMNKHVHRYQVDFSFTDKGHASTNSDIHGSFSSIDRRSSRMCPLFSFCRCLWRSFQSAIQKARERRAELLLQQREEQTCRQSSWIFFVTLCDATDRGILLVIGILIVWIIAIVLVKNPKPRLKIIIAGTVFLVLRLGTRPLVGFCLQYHNIWQLQSSLHPIPQRSLVFLSPLSSVTKTQGSHYLNRKMNVENTDRDETELTIVRFNLSGEDLPPSLQLSLSNESDPAIAAIC